MKYWKNNGRDKQINVENIEKSSKILWAIILNYSKEKTALFVRNDEKLATLLFTMLELLKSNLQLFEKHCDVSYDQLTLKLNTREYRYMCMIYHQ